MVITGEASARLNPKHSAGDSEAVRNVADPRDERVVDDARNGAAELLLLTDHLREFFPADKLEAGQEGLEVVVAGPVINELEADGAAAAASGDVVGDGVCFPDDCAGGFRGAEGDEQAGMREAAGEAEEGVDVALA